MKALVVVFCGIGIVGLLVFLRTRFISLPPKAELLCQTWNMVESSQGTLKKEQ